MSISSWIDGLPTEPTAYLNTEQQRNPRTALRPTGKRKVLTEVSWNLLHMPLSHNGNGRTPLTARPKKRFRTDGADDEDETPRARLERKTFNRSVFEASAPTQYAPSSPSRSSASASSDARSASPSKRVGDLQLLPRTITYLTVNDKVSPLPTAAEPLISKIRKIGKGKRLVPASQKAVAQQWIENDELDDYNFDPSPSPIQIPGTFSAAEVWNRVQEIMEAAALCEGDLCSESAWNSEVHCRLLRLALRGWRSARHVSYMDVTTARVDASSAPISKMVDYALVLIPGCETHKAITAKIRRCSLLSINHTKAEYVRFKPITASIETKRPGMDEDKGKVQLGVWAAAHLERLRILCGPHTILPILPEVIVQGHDWRLKIASMTGDGDVVLHGDWAVGDTRTVIGIYKILATIQTLAEWSINDYQPWFLEEVIGSGKPA